MTWKSLCIASALLLALGARTVSPSAGSVNGLGPEGIGASQSPSAEAERSEPLDMEDLKRRLGDKGMAIGSPVMIRVFKDESQLEFWVRKGERFELFAVYPICNWSGVLGPKLTEGDKQSPEGFYSVGARQLHRSGRWRRSLDIGFPNSFDKAHGRTGSYILVHGGCTSTGCFAMTNKGMEEIFTLSEAALAKGQERIHVHLFPFRMTQENLARHAESPWSSFWHDLKGTHDLFERTRVPPRVSMCDKRYVADEAALEDRSDCVANVSEVSTASARLRSVRSAARGRRARVARSAAHPRHARAAGRNARRAYAAARAARVAAHARRQTAGLGGPEHKGK